MSSPAAIYVDVQCWKPFKFLR